MLLLPLPWVDLVVLVVMMMMHRTKASSPALMPSACLCLSRAKTSCPVPFIVGLYADPSPGASLCS